MYKNFHTQDDKFSSDDSYRHKQLLLHYNPELLQPQPPVRYPSPIVSSLGRVTPNADMHLVGTVKMDPRRVSLLSFNKADNSTQSYRNN